MPALMLPPGMLALSTGLGDSGEDAPYESYEDLGEGPFHSYGEAAAFRDNELHPDLAGASLISGNSQGMYRIRVPRLLRQRISGSGQQEVLTPSHAVHAPAEPDFHDPAHPKVTAWHNDIAYTVPVHPQALSKGHMQALADYEVHRRQHEKLEKELHGEHDEYGDRPWVVSEEAARRLDRSQEQLNRLRDIAQGAGHAAVGLINSYFRFARRKFYQGVRQGQHREYRGQVLPDRKAAEESMPGGQIEEFPGIWSIVDHRGRVVWSGLSSHPYYSNFGDPGWRERILTDARNKNLVARRLSHSFGDPPDIDMSKVPITTWGKTRKKTGEWFSNLPPGMIPAQEPVRDEESLQLAGTEPVEQVPWEVQNLAGTEFKVKDVPLGEGEDNVLHFQAAPQKHLVLTPETSAIIRKNELDAPHDLLITRGKTYSKEITGQGNSAQFISHGHHAIRELLQTYRPAVLTFTAQEPSRQRAYYHAMRNLARDPQASKEYRFFGRPDNYYFNIVHKSIADLPLYRGMHKTEIAGTREPSSRMPLGMKPVTEPIGPVSSHPSQAVGAANASSLSLGMLRLDGDSDLVTKAAAVGS